MIPPLRRVRQSVGAAGPALAGVIAVAAASAQPTVYTEGVVAADHALASRAGAEMLARGGSAVDAAIATSLTLSVVRPMSCGIGGGGFMLIYDPSRPEGERAVALDYRESAPAAVGTDFFRTLDDPDASRFTGAAAGVPGTVAGLAEAHRRFGALPWADLFGPAIRAAEDGFAVDESYMRSAREAIRWYEADPSRKDRFGFVWRRLLRDGAVAEGDVIRNPEQARALRLIARGGPDAFYTGEIAREIVRAAQDAGGVITAEDLAGYTPRAVRPLEGEFLGRRVLTMPLPSSGGVALIQTLGALERYAARRDATLAQWGPRSPDYLHALTEAFKHAFADRAALLGDTPEARAAAARLISPDALDSIAARIDPDTTQPRGGYGAGLAASPPPDDAGTSHLSVVDGRGMAVACTETINLTFGSRVAVEPFGFCLNNEMDDFTTAPGAVNAFGLRQSDANLPAPGKRPLSSMTPTIALDRAGRVELVAGAAGGPRIITGTAQAVLNVLAFGMSADRAVSAPRIHHQFFPPVLAVEPGLIEPPAPAADAGPAEVMRMVRAVEDGRRIKEALETRGHRLGRIESVGVVQIVRRSGDGFQAASDPRRGGSPAGVRAGRVEADPRIER